MLREPRSSSFWVSRNLSHHTIRQARTGDTVSVKSREMTSGVVAEGRRVKDYRKENTLAQLFSVPSFSISAITYVLFVQADMEQVQEVQDEDLHQHPPPDLQVCLHT
jgi:hypothetical protein